MLLQLILNEAQLRSDSERHKLEAERAHSLVVEAQLSALRSRINPHFLFNAHTAIAALCSIAPSKAEAAILRLSQMMRRTLEAKSDESLNFEEELEYVRAYLEIEQLRFEDHLSVVWEIDPKIRNLRLPAFTLQTLVENAVRHGIAPKLGAGEIRIIVRTSHYGTMIAVLDNGAGMTPARRVAALAVNERPEHGLQITTLQLTLLYGDRARVRLFSQEEIGTMAALLIPYPSGGKKYGSKK